MVGDEEVVLGLSGGIDSALVATIAAAALAFLTVGLGPLGLGFGRLLDAEQSTHAGIKYMSRLVKQIDRPGKHRRTQSTRDQ